MTALARVTDILPVCSERKHERLKRDVNALNRVCTFIGEQRDEGFPTLLLYNCHCGSTLAIQAGR